MQTEHSCIRHQGAGARRAAGHSAAVRLSGLFVFQRHRSLDRRTITNLLMQQARQSACRVPAIPPPLHLRPQRRVHTHLKLVSR